MSKKKSKRKAGVSWDELRLGFGSEDEEDEVSGFRVEGRW